MASALRLLTGLGLLVFSGCEKYYVTEYYDRNHDGTADAEVRFNRQDVQNHCATCGGWAIMDSDFDGRFDLRWEFLFGDSRKKVDIPVPRGVTISKNPPSIVSF